MTRFVLADPVADIAVGVPFEAFLDIVKSSAIRSAATGDNFFEIGTSENVNVRFQATPDGDIEITMFSTLNDGDRPPLRLQLSGDDEELPASEVERRIRAIRQSYAIAYMVDARRTVELARLLGENPDADIEEACLPAKERLYIGTLTPGSLWLTLLTKSKKAYSVLRYGLALPFAEGRFALLERVKADTRLTQLAVEEREVDLVRKRHAGSIDTIRDIEKIKDPVIRQRIMDAFVGQLSVAGGKPEKAPTKALRKVERAEVPPSALLKMPASSPAVTVKKATRKDIAATLQIENKPNGGGSKG